MEASLRLVRAECWARNIYLRIEWWMAGWVEASLGLVRAECWARRRKRLGSSAHIDSTLPFMVAILLLMEDNFFYRNLRIEI